MKSQGVYAAFAVLLVCIVGATAQESISSHSGVPQDWTQHQLVFTRDGLLEHPDVLYREPRVLFQAAQRWRRKTLPAVPTGLEAEALSTASSTAQDWNVGLGTGRISANMFPAKWGFDPSTAPSCTSDYVIFGLATTGTTGGQANLVAFNNLYSNPGGTGFCPGTGPKVLFAYNITTVAGGRISTSPVISVDGTKIAFVENTNVVGGPAIFHVLTWTAGQGTIAASAAPTMTSITYSPTANSTTSSPWIDYTADTAYVGADNGKIYKFTGVFNGTPALVSTAPWPITVSNNLRLTPPVLDSRRGLLMVGSANGRLYQINITTGAIQSLIVGRQGQRNPGILGAPIVDVTNGTTFVVSANDGTSGVLVEADTTTLTQLAKGRIGLASANGTTTVSLYQPALSNDYFNNPSAGNIRLCGTGAATIEPWQYSFGFTMVNNQPVMNATPSFSQQLLTSTAARCTGWIEFFNPNITGGTDFFFFGLTTNCVGASGCVASTTGDTAATTAAVAGGPSGIVADNFSTASEASSIYFSARGTNRGFKFRQNGLLP